MDQLLTPELDVAAIDVEPDFNARKTMDPEKLKRLAGSFKSTGVVEPIVVVPGKKAVDSRSLPESGGSKRPSSPASSRFPTPSTGARTPAPPASSRTSTGRN